MSRSHHVNFTHLRDYSRKELDEMAKDPDSLLNQITDKIHAKKTEKKERKKKKQTPPNI